MTTPPAAVQTDAANQARRRRTEQKLRHVADVVAHLHKANIPVTYRAVAARAGVSRTFLYDNPAARQLITTAIADCEGRRRQHHADRDARAEASWRQRALNAEQAVTDAHAEIRAQRRRIGELLGQLRDAERELTEDTIQHITSENTTLKHRLRQLTADNRTLEERLQAARSNNRFLDKRVADLEAQLLDLSAR